jgi:SecD/SecF fusion protein
MSMFGFVLTLPGIAGIILTIGMAIDANVLIFERFKEERAADKELRPALEGAYSKAFSAILDANVTTLITAFILFWFASGPVKGFAVTLTIGILASMFSALLVTRNIFEWLVAKNWVKKLSMTNVLENTSFDFLGKRKVALIMSIILMIAALGTFAIRGQKALGPEFAGGDLLRVDLPDEVALDQLRADLTEIALENATIQRESTADAEFFSIRTDFNTSNLIIDALEERYAEAGFSPDRDVISDEQIGPVVGRELLRSSAVALLLGLLVIMAYVWLRFEISFAVGAIVAVIHDVVATLGLFVLFGGELSLMIVGAILTIAGYSINDTIVVFDRIRETIRTSTRKLSIAQLINLGLNQTIQRTLLTSATTLVTVVVLVLAGGPVLRDFALVLLIGILIGTYSSIFVASPIVLWWTRWRRKDLRTEVKEEEMMRKEGTVSTGA